jgi:hypothetical protein
VTVSALGAAEVSERLARRLGLDPTVHDAFTSESTAEALRRAASLLCPATPGEIVDAVRAVLVPLAGTDGVDREDLVTQLELLIANGDLLELRQSGERTTRLIYLGPPSFVTKVPGQYLLLGVRPEGRPLLDEELSESLEREGHLRLATLDLESGPAALKAAGLQEVRTDRWLRHPRPVAAADHVAALDLRLGAALQAGAVEGLEILDPAKPVHYYRGRWRALDLADRGDFVGRRPQAYGAAAWCFVRVADGRPTRLLDLPAEDAAAHARDEAWRLQAAVDAARGTPQRYRLRQVPGDDTTRILDLFGPAPSWTARQLDLVGTPVEKSRGALFSYRLVGAAIPSATKLLTDMLWMQPRDDGDTQ